MSNDQTTVPVDDSGREEERSHFRRKAADLFKHLFDNYGFQLRARKRRENSFVPHVSRKADPLCDERVSALESNPPDFRNQTNVSKKPFPDGHGIHTSLTI